MDRLDYAPIVRDVLARYLGFVGSSHTPDLDTAVLFDDHHKTYAIFDVGWQGKDRIETILVFLRLKDHKVWVEIDRTDYGFVDELLRAGVPEKDIVLAFHHPLLRPYADFAAA